MYYLCVPLHRIAANQGLVCQLFVEKLQFQQDVLLVVRRVGQDYSQGVSDNRIILVYYEPLEELIVLVLESETGLMVSALEPGNDNFQDDHLVNLVFLGLLDSNIVDHQAQVELVDQDV